MVIECTCSPTQIRSDGCGCGAMAAMRRRMAAPLTIDLEEAIEIMREEAARKGFVDVTIAGATWRAMGEG